MSALNAFLEGAICLAAVIAAIFFWSFWRQSRDRLFVFFSAAFAVFAAHWACVTFLAGSLERPHQVYFLRLLTFTLILIGIVDKNWRDRIR